MNIIPANNLEFRNELRFEDMPDRMEISKFLEAAQNTFANARKLDDQIKRKFIDNIVKIEADRGSLACAWNIMERLPGLENDSISTTLVTSLTLAVQERDDTAFSVMDCIRIFTCQNSRSPQTQQEHAAISLQFKKVIKSIKKLDFVVCSIKQDEINRIKIIYKALILPYPQYCTIL